MPKNNKKKRSPKPTTSASTNDLQLFALKLGRICLLRQNALAAEACCDKVWDIGVPVMKAAMCAANVVPSRMSKEDTEYLADVLAVATKLQIMFSRFTRTLAKCKGMDNHETRANIMAYFFSIAIQNCLGTDLDRANALMSQLGTFCYHSELLKIRDNWGRIRLTGSLYNDIRTNFVARKGMTAPQNVAIQFISSCLEAICDQFIYSLTTRLSVRAVLPFIPDAGSIDGFISGFSVPTFTLTKSRQKKMKDSAADITTKLLVELFAAEGPGSPLLERMFWDSSCYDFGNPVQGGSFQPKDNIIDMEMKPANKANHGVNLLYLLGATQIAAHNIRAGETDLMLDGEHVREILFAEETLPSFAYKWKHAANMASLLDRERQELELAIQTAETLAHKEKSLEAQAATISNLNQLKQAMSEITKQNEGLKALLVSKNAKLDAQTEKIEGLEASLSAEQRQRLSVEEQLRATVAQNEKLQEDARNWMRLHSLEQEPQQTEDAQENPYDTKVFDNLSVVVVGGHQSWAIAMRTFHPNIKIYDAEGPAPSDDVIKNADIMWVQTNAIPHPISWRVVEVAKAANTPFRTFSFAGHRQCKKQMVAETKAFFGKEATQQRMGT